MSPDSAYGPWTVGSKCGEGTVNTHTQRVTSFGGGSVMGRDSISVTGKIRLVIIGGNPNAERYQGATLQFLAIPYLQRIGPNSIL